MVFESSDHAIQELLSQQTFRGCQKKRKGNYGTRIEQSSGSNARK